MNPHKAPGTFGYDYSKYRSPRKEEIPMDEFGKLPDESQEISAPVSDSAPPPPSPIPEEPETPIRRDRRKVVGRPPDSLAPSSQYRHTQIPTINVTRPSTDLEPVKQVPRRHREREVEEVNAGCCKCVVM
jgi:hypothetical protein